MVSLRQKRGAKPRCVRFWCAAAHGRRRLVLSVSNLATDSFDAGSLSSFWTKVDCVSQIKFDLLAVRDSRRFPAVVVRCHLSLGVVRGHCDARWFELHGAGASSAFVVSLWNRSSQRVALAAQYQSGNPNCNFDNVALERGTTMIWNPTSALQWTDYT